MHSRLPIVVVVLVVAVVAVVLWTQPPSAAAAPLLQWRFGRPTEVGGPGTPATQFAKVAADTPVRLVLKAREPLYVYVASFSQTDGTLALFPTPMLATELAEPVPTGEHTLPGTKDGRTLHWPVRGGVPGATDYVVVASREALPDLAEALAHCRYFSNTTFPDHSLVFTNPKDCKAEAVLGRTALPHALLLAAQQVNATDPNVAMTPAPGHAGVWIASLKLAPVAGQ